MKLNAVAGHTRRLVKEALLSASKTVWRAPLTHQDTLAYLRDYIVLEKHHPPVYLPRLAAANGGTAYHDEEHRSLDPDYVWELRQGGAVQSLTVCRSGGVLVNNKWLLDLDFSATAGLLDSPLKRQQEHYPLIVAPWSHFWKGFFDYTSFVIAKLCRIESVYGPTIWQQAKVCYPLQHTGYERDLLRKLGIPASALIDTTPYWGTSIHADRIILGNNHPSWCSSADDLTLLRNRFRESDRSGSHPKQKIYLSRKGRRKVQNEEAVTKIMHAYGFTIVEDEPYTMDEQIALFQSASVVVTPHGAALTNLLWCDPGTKVLEFFYNGYTPNYFYYTSTVLQLDYSFLVDYSAGAQIEHWTNKAHDVTVDLAALEYRLQQLLA